MRNLIGIVGKVASGKDTVMNIIQLLGGEHQPNITDRGVELVVEILNSDTPINGPYENKKNSEYLKQVASLITGVPRDNFESQDFKKERLPEEWINEELKIYTWRDFLIRIGTDALRNNLHPDVWVNSVYKDYQSNFKWIFTDVRFKNEAHRLEKEGGVLIKINRVKTLREWLEFYNLATGNLDDEILQTPFTAEDFRNEVICEIDNWFDEDDIDCHKIVNIKNVMFHPSETELDDYEFQHVINNDGTLEELVVKVNNILKEIELWKTTQ